MKKFLIIATLLGVIAQVNAQSQEDEDDDKWASPRVKNMMPRGIVASYTPVTAYDIESHSNLNGLPDADTRVDHLNKLLFKIKAPILLRKRTNIIIGLDYAQDQYKFKSSDFEDYALYKSLHDKRMKSRVFKFYYDHSIDEKHWLYIRSSAALNGDVGDLNLSIYEFAKYTMAAFYGWKKSENNSYGIGLYMSYDLGQPSIYPAFLWNKTINDHWGFESKIPAQFQWRYNVNDKQRFFAGYEVSGASYNVKLDDEQLARYNDLQLRRSDVFASLTYERAVISDFIWMAVSAGYRFNYKLDISEDDSFKKSDPIIENDISPSPYFNFSVFFTPSETIKEVFLDE